MSPPQTPNGATSLADHNSVSHLRRSEFMRVSFTQYLGLIYGRRWTDSPHTFSTIVPTHLKPNTANDSVFHRTPWLIVVSQGLTVKTGISLEGTGRCNRRVLLPSVSEFFPGLHQTSKFDPPTPDSFRERSPTEEAHVYVGSKDHKAGKSPLSTSNPMHVMFQRAPCF